MKRRDPPTPAGDCCAAAQQSIVNEEFAVGGAYGFLLRVSSFFGVAPLRFRPHGSGYFVSISIPVCIYSYLMMTVLAAIALLIMSLNDPYNIRNASNTSASKLSEAVSKCEQILFFIKAATGVFGAPTRMRCMLKCMKAMTMVDQIIDAQYSQAKERRLWRGLVLFTFLSSMLVFYDFLVIATVETKGDWAMLIYVGVIYIMFCLIIILQIQFAFIVMSVYTRFKAINQILTISTNHLSVSYDHKVKNLDVLNILAFRVASGDAESETVIVRESRTSMPRPVLSGTLSDTVQRIAMVQGLLYDVVHNINKSYGPILVLMMTSLLIDLISIVYFGILKMLSDNFYNYEIMQCLWFCFYLLTLFMLVEPCHYTTAEGKMTEIVVNRMIMESPATGPLASRLELFARQLMLQHIGYKPMGFFCLNRSLVVSIFGMIVTYLVILLQFED